VQVAVWYFTDCPNWRAAGQRMRQALDDAGHRHTAVIFRRVDADTDVTGFAGSPTFTIDGIDLFPAEAAPGGLSCRVYLTAAGPAGLPTVADLVAAIRERTTP
jgi:hypothetical protein